MHIYISLFMHIYISLFMYIYISLFMYIYISLFMYIYISVSIYTPQVDPRQPPFVAATHCLNILQHDAEHFSTRQHRYRNTLQHDATFCNTPQHTAALGNTRQPTFVAQATHSRSLLYVYRSANTYILVSLCIYILIS